jgi:hypothetical protein
MKSQFREMLRIVAGIFAAGILISCNSAPADPNKGIDPGNKNGVVTFMGRNNKVAKTTTYKNDRKNGPERIYFLSGDRIRLESNYADDVLEGEEKRFYENGTLYQSTWYTQGVKNGIQKTFHPSGKLRSQLSFRNDQPGKDLAEFDEHGAPVVYKLPEIIVTPVDRIAMEQKYALRLRLSSKAWKVRFYIGDLHNNMYFDPSVSVPLLTQNGEAEYNVYLPSGMAVMKKITIVALLTSRFGNPIIVSRSYNLAAQNSL